MPVIAFTAVEESETPYASDVISENGVDTIRLHGDANAEADMETLLHELNLPNLNAGMAHTCKSVA